ncbi:MAG: AIPR family protein [Bacilli bacterium]|nr:AIPR family protein [Bacilli bacterium]
MNNKIINSYVDNFCDQYCFDLNKFLLFSTYQICKKNNLDENMLIDSVIEGGGDGGIDSIVILVDKKYMFSLSEFNEYSNNINENSKIEIYIIQAKETNGIKESAFMKIKDSFDRLLLNEISLNIKKQYKKTLIEKFMLINDILIKVSPKTNNIYFNISYAYTGKLDNDSISVGTKSQMDSIKRIISERVYIDESKVVISIFDSAKLITEANKSVSKDYIIKYKTIFKMNYCSEAENGFVMNMSLKDYYNLITKDSEIIDELFEGNIRDYEGESVEVNKNIKNSLENVFEADFWWLNNGVTMIVDSYSPLPNDSAKVVNPIIVNGLQTSYTIFNYFNENEEKLAGEQRNILLKVITTDSVSISDMIISSTNRQNPVKPAQLKATDPIQKDIEQLLLQSGIYYERRKNFYRNRGYDIRKIVTLENLSQYLESIYFGDCSGARNNPTSLLKSDKLYKKLFNKQNDPMLYAITAKIALRTLEELRQIKKENKDIFKTKYSVSLDIFKFYIMRIVTLVLCKNDVQSKFLEIDFNLLDKQLVFDVILYLETIVADVLCEIDNIINVSKSKELDNRILSIDLSKVTAEPMMV